MVGQSAEQSGHGENAEQSENMATINATSAPTTTSAPASMALTAVNVSRGAVAIPHPAHTSSQHINVQEAAEEAWALVTKALMLAVMGSQLPIAAATTLLAIFRPMVDGWDSAHREGKWWKGRAEAYIAEHHRHKTESAHKHDTLQAQVQALEKSLGESQSQARDFESQHSTLCSNVSSLQTTLAEAEVAAGAAEEANAREAQERKEEAEAMTKSAQDAELMYEKLREEVESKERERNAKITRLLDKNKESEGIISKFEERLAYTIPKNASLEEDLAHKIQEISNLQSRAAELTARKEALERQLALYQRIPSRRF